jgi:hypothetical protein
MSKSTVSALLLGLATAGVIVTAVPATAADLAVPAARAARACPRCGCVQVWYIHHPELRSTYGLSYDPRNYDQTEPHYYHGPVRAYPRYAVEGIPPIE